MPNWNDAPAKRSLRFLQRTARKRSRRFGRSYDEFDTVAVVGLADGVGRGAEQSSDVHLGRLE